MQQCTASRHMAVCRAAQETQGARQTSMYFTGVKKTSFASMTLSDQKQINFLS